MFSKFSNFEFLNFRLLDAKFLYFLLEHRIPDQKLSMGTPGNARKMKSEWSTAKNPGGELFRPPTVGQNMKKWRTHGKPITTKEKHTSSKQRKNVNNN